MKECENVCELLYLQLFIFILFMHLLSTFRLLNFNEPVEFRGAGIGRNQKDWFGIEAPYSGIIQPLETCAEMASYNTEMQAAKFGDEPYSHAKIPIGRKEFVDE